MGKPRVHAQMTTKFKVFCKEHDVDEPLYEEYVGSVEVAEAWIALHDLQYHGSRR